MQGEQVCPRYHRAVELIGKRWTGAIVRVLLSGPRRFHEITGAVPGLSDRLLTRRLRELEAEGILARRVCPRAPAREEYLLTAKGRALEEVVDALSRWAERWLAEGRQQAASQRQGHGGLNPGWQRGPGLARRRTAPTLNRG